MGIYYNHEELRSEIKCNDSTITTYFFVVLCILTYYSWGTRRALSVFKESTCAYFSSFLSLLCRHLRLLLLFHAYWSCFTHREFISFISNHRTEMLRMRAVRHRMFHRNHRRLLL